MKFKSSLSPLSFGLSALIIFGNTLSTLAIAPLRSFSLEPEVQLEPEPELLLAGWGFRRRYRSAPRRRSWGLRRGNGICLKGNENAIAFLPAPASNLTRETSVLKEFSSNTQQQKQASPLDINEVQLNQIEPPENPLAPVEKDSPDLSDQVWLTAAEYPNIYFYLPENWATKGEFVLYDQDYNIMYSAVVSFPGEATKEEPRPAGVIEINMAEKQDETAISPLIPGENYIWELEVLCDDVNRSNNPMVDGWIQRLDESAQTILEQDLNGVSEVEKHQIYAEQGIWYSLVSQVYHQSNATVSLENWQLLLETVGEPAVLDASIVGSAEIGAVYEKEYPPFSFDEDEDSSSVNSNQ